ncbi:low-density lipoprotein receptor-related protein 2-like isoform X2 [Biomphalaria glabrata]|uniref:Low-density lipoprotein receptor-related protein 2-like isoform X2 n=1 Tax=Biomphalaria glabrata TaxID=6526 RepID=A0A9W2Z3Q3_BIOGL|nr:low-density lipoprotein receptor-related protein 2-like isoform X2 [Biomphalaria glabrata]
MFKLLVCFCITNIIIAIKSQCYQGQWECKDSACIRDIKQCNGEFDCRDQSDELDCKNCTSDAWPCKKNDKCIKNSLRCDGTKDCPDNSDETDCVTCLQGAYRCNNSECIRESNRCNGYRECSDNSDELSCDICKFSGFRCDDRECILASYRCNGKIDCRDSSDEKDCDICKGQSWKCNTNQCISRNQICDGKEDCEDKSDETICICSDQQVKCDNKICIHASQVCDGINNCYDNSDEKNCRTPCNKLEWTCHSGQCIETGLRCDGTAHCSDKSDEIDCFCSEAKFNLVIALESSESQFLKLFLQDLLRDIAINSKNVRVGIMGYGDQAVTIFQLSTTARKVDMLDAVTNFKWSFPHNANYEAAFSNILVMSTPDDNDKRQNLQTILIFTTSTLDESNYLSAAKGAKLVQENGVKIVAIGVSLKNETYLDLIASPPADENTLAVQYFEDLHLEARKLVSWLCPKDQLLKGVPQNNLTTSTTDKETTNSTNLTDLIIVLIVSLVVIIIVLVLTIVSIKLKLLEKLGCFSSRKSTNAKKKKDYLDIDHYDYLLQEKRNSDSKITQELKNETVQKSEIKELKETFSDGSEDDKEGKYLSLHNDHVDVLDSGKETKTGSGYITAIDVVYEQNTANVGTKDYEELEQATLEENVYHVPISGSLESINLDL